MTIILAIWFFGWLVTWPALLADFQNESPSLADEGYRHDLGVAMLLAALPPAWILTPFLTGFYEAGFQVRRRRA